MTETALSFDDLSDEAKEHARRKLRESPGYMDGEWWDAVYEDAKECGKRLGIDISKIYFSGFASQGDGASFDGKYKYTKSAVEDIVAHASQDEELKRIAEEITKLQVTSVLAHGATMYAACAQQGRYMHAGSIDVEVFLDDDVECDDYSDVALPLRTTLRSFADWIYRQLETENDYLLSDECLDQRLVDLSFDEDGDII